MDLHKKGQPEKTRYEFGKTGFEEGKWLDCTYGRAGEVSISRRLGDAMTLCVITNLEGPKTYPQRIQIDCK